MRHACQLLAACCALLASAAGAERLDLDHRLYPPLHEAMEHPHQGTVFFDANTPGRVFDRIVVTGTSAEHDWTEALELLVTPRKTPRLTPQAWLAGFRPDRESLCPAQITPIGQDENSLTFALEASACPQGPGLSGLYRVVVGRKTVYLVSAKLKGTMSPSQREQWLAVLQSARLSG